ncbi:hypothetical protein ALC62_03690 [Cyphomyrmex costatus]|uniref:Uncharacterized protein n=1 Tax=Cyphomyrmex costatus TaxID=456900 RepID=A0A195CXM0_9HYME|nr:hypothetical protein ALC62_03690 [Cyphomyrmex costatus]
MNNLSRKETEYNMIAFICYRDRTIRRGNARHHCVRAKDEEGGTPFDAHPVVFVAKQSSRACASDEEIFKKN